MQSCRANTRCNAWVYCGNTGGCNDGYGQVYRYGICTLKEQAALYGGNSPQLYGSYGTSEFTSGRLLASNGAVRRCIL